MLLSSPPPGSSKNPKFLRAILMESRMCPGSEFATAKAMLMCAMARQGAYWTVHAIGAPCRCALITVVVLSPFKCGPQASGYRLDDMYELSATGGGEGVYVTPSPSVQIPLRLFVAAQAPLAVPLTAAARLCGRHC